MAAAAVHRRALTALVPIAFVLASCGGTDQPSAASVAPSTESAATSSPTTTPPPSTEPATTPPPTEPVTTPPPTEPATTAPLTEPATSLAQHDPKVTVMILDLGAEPRAELRYRLQPGTATLRLTQSQVISQTIDGQEVPSAGELGSVIDTVFTVEPVAGSYELTSDITAAAPHPDVDPTLVDTMAETLETMIGVRTVSTLDDRGLVQSAAIDEASLAGVPDEVASLMSSLAEQGVAAPPLPDEAVGVGAQWRAVQRLVVTGIPITQTSEYTLLAIDGDIVTLTATGSQAVDLGPVEMPGLPPGSNAEITAWDADIAADMVCDLTQPIPTGTIRSRAVQSFVIAGGGQSIALDQTVEIEQRFERLG